MKIIFMVLIETIYCIILNEGNNIMEKAYFKNEYVELWMSEDLLIGKYSSEKITLEIAKEIVQARKNISGGKSFYTIEDWTKGFLADKNARDYMAGPEGVEGVLAGGIIVQTTMQKILFNAFVTFSKPKVPIKIFSHQKDAMEWLKSIKTEFQGRTSGNIEPK